MQFWFNMSSVNTSEDLIECYFHIYKKRAPVIHSLKSHTVSVRYFIIEQIERFRFPRWRNHHSPVHVQYDVTRSTWSSDVQNKPENIGFEVGL